MLDGTFSTSPTRLTTIAGPEEAQGLQRFWPLHHLAFKFLNLACHVMCSLHELLCILLIISCNVLLKN